MPRQPSIRSTGPATLSRIAQLAGTSKSTVSRVLSNHPRIAKETRDKVLSIAGRLQFRPNRFARALAGGGTGLIGVISSNIGSGFYAEVLRGIDLVVSESDSHVLCSFAHRVEDYDALATDLVQGGAVDGMILIAPPRELFAQRFAMQRVPVVLCAARAPEGAWADCSSIVFDNAAAMAELVDHLAAQGCARIVHVEGPSDNFDAAVRKDAFLAQARRQRGLRLSTIPGGWTSDEGRNVMRRLLHRSARLPDAFVAFNDSLAIGMLEELRGTAADAPHVAFTGWDDNPAAALAGLTSVRMPIGDMGMRAARSILLRLPSAPTGAAARLHEQVPLEVVVRTSSRARG